MYLCRHSSNRNKNSGIIYSPVCRSQKTAIPFNVVFNITDGCVHVFELNKHSYMREHPEPQRKY